MSNANLVSAILFVCGNRLPQAVLATLLQGTLLVIAALCALRAARRRSPAIRLFLANSALAAVAALLVLAVLSAGQIPAVWTLTLPGASDTTQEKVSSPLIAHRSDLLTMRPSLQEGLLTGRQTARLPDVNAATENDVPDFRSNFTDAGPIRAIPLARAALHGANSAMVSRATHFYSPVYILLAVIWGSGVLVLSAWIAFAYISVGYLYRCCRPVNDVAVNKLLLEQCANLQVRPPVLLISDRVHGPFFTGLWRPAIVLPDDYRTEFDAETLRGVLVHELAHLVLRDAWWTLLTRLLCALLWPHPLLWALCRKRVEASEEACDVLVLSHGCPRTVYARCLLSLAEHLRQTAVVSAATLGVIGPRSTLARRIERILTEPQPSSVLSMRVRIPILVLLVGFVLTSYFLVTVKASAQLHLQDQTTQDRLRLRQIVVHNPRTTTGQGVRKRRVARILNQQQRSEERIQLALKSKIAAQKATLERLRKQLLAVKRAQDLQLYGETAQRRAALANQRAALTTQRVRPDSEIFTVQQQLVAEQTRLADLRLKYTELDPTVAASRERIAGLTQQLQILVGSHNVTDVHRMLHLQLLHDVEAKRIQAALALEDARAKYSTSNPNYKAAAMLDHLDALVAEYQRKLAPTEVSQVADSAHTSLQVETDILRELVQKQVALQAQLAEARSVYSGEQAPVRVLENQVNEMRREIDSKQAWLAMMETVRSVRPAAPPAVSIESLRVVYGTPMVTKEGSATYHTTSTRNGVLRSFTATGKWTHGCIGADDRISADLLVGANQRTLEVKLSRVSESYDKDGQLIRQQTDLASTLSLTKVHGRITIQLPKLKASEVFVSTKFLSPAAFDAKLPQVVLIKYRYELSVRAIDAFGQVSVDTKMTDRRSLNTNGATAATTDQNRN